MAEIRDGNAQKAVGMLRVLERMELDRERREARVGAPLPALREVERRILEEARFLMGPAGPVEEVTGPGRG